MFGKLPQMHVCKVSKAVGHLVASSRVVDNTSYHSTIKTTPFEALYGYKTPQLGYVPFINVKTEGVGTWVKDHQAVLQQLKQLLQQAQQRMRQQQDKKMIERLLKEGDWVYLKLKPYKQLSLHKSKMWKLTQKYCGLFEVIQCIGPVAYKLQLPPDARVHPVFHVSQLKKHIGATDRVVASLPPLDDKGQYLLVPVAVLAKRMVKKNNAAVGEWLIQWAHLPESEATWEDATEIMKKYPSLK